MSKKKLNLDQYEEIVSDELESIVHPQQVESEAPLADFFKETPKKPETPKRTGTVVAIAKGFISINENGFGTRIKYDSTKHSSLKKGDIIEF